MSPWLRRQTPRDPAPLAGVHDVYDQARRVQAMFDAIVGRYELVNRLTALGLDGGWRRQLVARLELPRDGRVLDLACGTGQVLRCIARARPDGLRLWGMDFSGRMIQAARRAGPAHAWFAQADALRLPARDEAFDVVTCAFGVRNFADLDAGLREVRRVLRPGGQAAILEFSMPRAPGVEGLYRFYFRRVLPRLAGWISGHRGGAYHYLRRSVEAFDRQVDLQDRLRRAGFERVRVRSLTCGIVQLHTARRPAGGCRR